MLSGLTLFAGLAFANGALALDCSSSAFTASQPKHFGLEITEIKAKEVQNWNDWDKSIPATPALPNDRYELGFCEVQVHYTHPGLNDSVRIDIWLPNDKRNWNGKFLGQGGLGWASGNVGALAPGVAMGFATAQTDGGHSFEGHPAEVALSSHHWGLKSPGNVNLHELQTFSYRALEDLSYIAKRVVETYYSSEISYSYWNGCSTGARQGMELAQRYPKHFQGILAAAPSQNWATFLITEHWAHVMMKKLDYYPKACELNALTAAAVEECDGLDGVIDGIVAAHGLCKFDPHKLVGQEYDCEGETKKITKGAAEIAQAVWSGPVKDGKPIWYGLSHEASLPGLDPLYRGLAATDCDEKGECKSAPFGISADFIKTWVVKNTGADLTQIDVEKFYEILRISQREYAGFLNADNPDLEPFKAAGGKMIHWHGLADQLIPPNGSLNYYLRVKERMGERATDDFYKYFEAPGVAHCFGGDGAFPVKAMIDLMDWVERGEAPKVLEAISFKAKNEGVEEPGHTRLLCPYPEVQHYVGSRPAKQESFKCAKNFPKPVVRKAKKEGKSEL